MSRPKWINIVGPSGSMKSTVAKKLASRHPKTHWRPRATTRHPRDDDQEGEEYNYLPTNKRFWELVKEGKILKQTVGEKRDDSIDPPRNYYRGIWHPRLWLPVPEDASLIISLLGPSHSAWLKEEFRLDDMINFCLTGDRNALISRVIARHGTKPDRRGSLPIKGYWDYICKFKDEEVEKNYDYVIDTTAPFKVGYLTLRETPSDEIVREIERMVGLPSPE